MPEKWKAVRGYEGYYEVSTMGKVRSLDRQRTLRHSSGTYYTRIYKGKILTPVFHLCYPLVCLTKKQGKHKNHLVHRLVAEAFIPNPKNLPHVLHKDDDRANPRKSNLRWGTPMDNVTDMVVKGRQNRGSDRPLAVLDEKKVARIKKMMREGVGDTALSEKFGVARATMNCIRNGKTWKHVH